VSILRDGDERRMRGLGASSASDRIDGALVDRTNDAFLAVLRQEAANRAERALTPREREDKKEGQDSSMRLRRVESAVRADAEAEVAQLRARARAKDAAAGTAAAEHRHNVEAHRARMSGTEKLFADAAASVTKDFLSYLPSEDCLMCEDVAQTWRETFPCAGNAEPNWTPNDSVDFPACAFAAPCDSFRGETVEETSALQGVCQAEKDRFYSSMPDGLSMWKAVYEDRENTMQRLKDWPAPDVEIGVARPYQICRSLGVCTEDDKSCEDEFAMMECRDDPGCTPVVPKDAEPTGSGPGGDARYIMRPQVQKSDDSVACPQNCYMCYWIVRAFPLFQDYCQPMPDPLTRELHPFFNADNLEKNKLKWSRNEWVWSEASNTGGGSKKGPWATAKGSAGRSKLNGRVAGEMRGLGSPDFPPDESFGTLNKKLGDARARAYGTKETHRKCMDLWREFEMSPKARFLIQYKDRFGNHPWNANTACKCLGRCAYNSYEAMDLLPQCQYEHNSDMVASLFPDLPADLGAAKELDSFVRGGTQLRNVFDVKSGSGARFGGSGLLGNQDGMGRGGPFN
jgi:hypothetical protein